MAHIGKLMKQFNSIDLIGKTNHCCSNYLAEMYPG
jgi:hypothetical protein